MNQNILQLVENKICYLSRQITCKIEFKISRPKSEISRPTSFIREPYSMYTGLTLMLCSSFQKIQVKETLPN